ncbi:hypothetical protein [Nonomuraea sp. CA-141351]|uniref:hypothetical protein n=1 Tax=Nonomuraea sp. CA-141351 TaxID=3239996 RepID=UPI003D932016
MEQPSEPDDHAAEPELADPAGLSESASSRAPAGGLTYASDRAPAPDPDGHNAGAAGGNGLPPGPAPIMATKEHKRFLEFADAVRRKRYIGLCFGAPSVGKTESARSYTRWD